MTTSINYATKLPVMAKFFLRDGNIYTTSLCSTRHRVDASTDDIMKETHCKPKLTIPILDQLLMEPEEHFGTQQLLATNSLFHVPVVITLRAVIENGYWDKKKPTRSG